MNDSILSLLNEAALQVCDEAEQKHAPVEVIQSHAGTVIDFAPDGVGSLEGGILLTRICMGDLAKVALLPPASPSLPLSRVQVTTDHPLFACIASQYAGWPFKHGKYFAMCSGPARIARGKEEILTAYDLVLPQRQVVGVLETRTLPGDEEIAEFANECDVSPSDVTLCVAPTASLPAAVQIVGRSIETTLHKLHELRFDLQNVKSASGTAPLPPIPGDDMIALGWTNDAILYGAEVQLWVQCDDSQLEELGPRIPSNSSSDFGRPFGEIFSAYDHDFYKIDKQLFSPARVIINNTSTGNVFVYGETHESILKKSFGLS